MTHTYHSTPGERNRSSGARGEAREWTPFSLMFLALCIATLAFTVSGCDQTGQEKDRQSAETPGISDNVIRVGLSLALTGHASFLGQQTLYGATAFIDHVNANGGVHGRLIELVVYDDRYEPAMCLANTQKLIVDEDIFSLFCYVGTPTTVKIIPLVERAQIPLLGIFSGAKALRDPFSPYLINVRASYHEEVDAAVTRLVEDLGCKRIAVFYQYDAYGLDGLRGAELSLLRYGLDPVAKSSYIRGTLDVEQALARILASEAEAVVMVGTYMPCAKFIRLAKKVRPDLIFYNVSFVGAEELVRILGDQGDRIVVSQVVPPPELPETLGLFPLAGQFMEHYAEAHPEQPISSVSLEGYLNARVLVEALERTGPNPTRQGFIEAVQSIDEMKIGRDAVIRFGPGDHQGLDQVYFTEIRDGELRLLTDWEDLAERMGKRPPDASRTETPGMGMVQ
ncbi:ABC transporter substrate-binding protein [Oceanidesulfovibrio indonesiensis]|nr:ABC transporter substrate-binding protein [Oceanidesulfovibrio indonesiensis]